MFYFCLPFFLLIYTIEDKERKIELLLITEIIPFRRNKNPKPRFNNVAETYSTALTPMQRLAKTVIESRCARWAQAQSEMRMRKRSDVSLRSSQTVLGVKLRRDYNVNSTRDIFGKDRPAGVVKFLVTPLPLLVPRPLQGQVVLGCSASLLQQAKLPLYQQYQNLSRES